MKTKPPELARKSLMSVILGNNYRPDSFVARLSNRFELFKLLGLNGSDEIQFADRFEPALRLFFAIVDKIRDACGPKGVELRLVLMPRRSYVARPGSLSAQLQEYLREKILEDGAAQNISIIDLAGQLREQYEINPGKWYHPDEGHLTAEGHKVVANILSDALQ